MARPLRINLKNGWYHVANRGNNRQAIYLDERDRRHFLELLAQMRERYFVEIHSYVLIGNHYHLLVRTPEANLSAAVQWLNVAYSVWWTRRHGRSGHVFQGRFKAVLVEAGFLNKEEIMRLDNNDYRDQMAAAISEGILRYRDVLKERQLPLAVSGPGTE